MREFLITLFSVAASLVAYGFGYSHGKFDGACEAADALAKGLNEVLDRISELLDKSEDAST